MDESARTIQGEPGRPDVEGYRVGRMLGRGSSAVVWLATEQASGGSVALKCFDRGPSGAGGVTEPGPETEEAVRREVRILSVVEHAHLVGVRDVVRFRAGDDGGTGLALVLDYASGGSLAELIAAGGSLGPGETVTILTPVAQALSYLHGRGFTHGDVSPGNVLFTAHGKPLLSDLGVGRMIADAADAHPAGTGGFQDPTPVDPFRAGLQPEADVYSVAALGWYCLTGAPPPPEPQRAPLPLLVPGVPAALTAALESGLRLDRRLRPSAADFAAAVYRSATAAPVDLTVSAHPTVLPELLTHRSGPATPRERRAARRSAVVLALLRGTAAARERLGRRGPADGARPRPGAGDDPARLRMGAREDPAPRRTGVSGELTRRAEVRPRRGPAVPAEKTTWQAGRTRHRAVRRRGALRRAVLMALVAVAAAAGLVFLPALGDPEATLRQAVQATAPAAATADAAPDGNRDGIPADLVPLLSAARPEEAVQGLARLRGMALRTGNHALLARVTEPASPAAAADADVAARLAADGHVLDGFEQRLLEVRSRPLGSTWTGGAGAVPDDGALVQLAVTVATPAYRELGQDGALVAEAAAAGDQRLILVLAAVDGRWRIREILPAV
ncbi:serine/threonine-protein kinase [Arthrobacter sp. YD4]|uniref:serine/threonine-protein kinase n=1 Tax=Arthrobacter sp. YD4 TaxID=3058043 RepID=UPI0025B326FE|nr:serine/threonine-protein kinase [Arthrobacter sp. YD4]MDN3937119.1 serine/threonine-protein kinase [Arthrobacter sp. YD4]